MNEEIMEVVNERKNPFCVISIEECNEYGMHNIQTSSAWSKNPYSEGYAEVPDDMVEEIRATRGFCDITVENGIVTEFTAKEIPEIPEPEEEATQLDIIEAQVTYTAMMTDTLLEV